MLHHPNIVAYYDSFVEDKALMIVMEFAEGGTIFEYLQSRESLLEEEEILNLFVQMVLSLQQVHSHNILHRDLKTQNIMLDARHRVRACVLLVWRASAEGLPLVSLRCWLKCAPTRSLVLSKAMQYNSLTTSSIVWPHRSRMQIVKIGDFGISKVLSSKSKANTVVGTPCYISPELCEGKPYNQKSDIWALGCVLYELCTLQRAFDAPNLPALVLKIMRGTVAPLSETYR
jgi:NIMA (never in mitosis gene a)-related kinase 8